MKCVRLNPARRAACLALAALLLPLTSTVADAQSYPAAPIRLVVAFPPGGATDALARIVAAQLSESLGKPVVVENRPGAGGITGSDSVAKAAPDGYTLLIGAAGNIAINPSLYKTMPYDTLRDLVPVGIFASVMNLLVVAPTVQANNVQELIALAKANPGKLNFASSGSGSSLHLSGELFKMMTGVDIVHIPYKGSSQAMGDLLTGRVEMMFDNLPSSLPHVQVGKLKALGVTAKTRSPVLPNVPTIAEQGLPAYVATTWFGIFAPRATPAAIVSQLNAAITAAVANPSVAKQMRDIGAEPVSSSQPDFESLVRAETVKWADVVKASGAKVD